jgi:hypothetical protein
MADAAQLHNGITHQSPAWIGNTAGDFCTVCLRTPWPGTKNKKDNDDEEEGKSLGMKIVHTYSFSGVCPRARICLPNFLLFLKN